MKVVALKCGRKYIKMETPTEVKLVKNLYDATLWPIAFKPEVEEALDKFEDMGFMVKPEINEVGEDEIS